MASVCDLLTTVLGAVDDGAPVVVPPNEKEGAEEAALDVDDPARVLSL